MYRTPVTICALTVIVSLLCQSQEVHGSVTGPSVVETVPVPDSSTEGAEGNQRDPDKTGNLIKDPETKNEQSCQHLEVKGANQIQRIREIKSKDYSFFLRPKDDFERLTIRLRMQNILDVSEVFDTQETVEIHKLDLKEQPSEWVRIRIQYYRHSSRGPNYHALRITIGNETRTVVTNHWWFTYTYEGFLLSSEGGLDLLFNCSPEDYFVKAESSYPRFWLLAGGLLSLTLISVALGCIIVMYKKRQPQRNDTSSPPNSVTYDEFDKEMLARIQQKVEALREGRASESSSGGKKNDYVLHLTPMGKNSFLKEQIIDDDDNVFENHYEDIDELGVNCPKMHGQGGCENHYENVQQSTDNRAISPHSALNIDDNRDSYENPYHKFQGNATEGIREDYGQSGVARDSQRTQENVNEDMQVDINLHENHYKLPTSVKKVRSSLRMSCHKNHDENHYEILYPLGYDETPRAKCEVPRIKL